MPFRSSQARWNEILAENCRGTWPVQELLALLRKVNLRGFYGLLASELFAWFCIVLLFGEAGWMLTDAQWPVLTP